MLKTPRSIRDSSDCMTDGLWLRITVLSYSCYRYRLSYNVPMLRIINCGVMSGALRAVWHSSRKTEVDLTMLHPIKPSIPTTPMFMTYWRPICWAFCTIRYQDVTQKCQSVNFKAYMLGFVGGGEEGRGGFSFFFLLFFKFQDRWWWNVSNVKHFQSIPFRSNTFHHSISVAQVLHSGYMKLKKK